MCARRRVDGMSRPAAVADTMIPTPAQYSGLPKRTSRGTNSASAAEKAIRVRVGRLRRAVNAAADGSDAAIAMNTFAALTIFETMTDRATLFLRCDRLARFLRGQTLASYSSV